MKIVPISLFFLLTLSACNSEPIANSDTWTPSTKGPWDGALFLATSSDGLAFEGKEMVLERAGVPNLLELQNDELILVYQYFSDSDEDMFDVIAYSISNDNGTTWSGPQAIDFEALPEALDSNKKPMDPTLVQLEDGRLRLYFTYHAKGNPTAALYSASAEDGNIDSTFTVDTNPALVVPGDNLLDPAVTFFNGVWHHYSWQMDSDNYHSTSTDGLSFTLQDEISLPMDFLGQVILFEDGLRFYGTGEGVTTAFSNDGFTWQIDGPNLVQGADPAVQKLSNGTYLMVYTSMNFN